VLTLTEAAARLGLAASTLRHQAQAGRLRATLFGKTYVVSEREVERYRREHLGKPGRPVSHRAAPPLDP
jgi:excisionase family DNA binding protein